MFLSKKSMFKDDSIFLILVQSRTMLHFPGYISSSRQSLDNLFTPFERTYVGVVFDIKIPAGNHYAFPEERIKKAQNSTFLGTPSKATRSGGLVTKIQALVISYII